MVMSRLMAILVSLSMLAVGGCSITPLGMAYSAFEAGLTGSYNDEGRLKGSIKRNYDPRVYTAYPELGIKCSAKVGERVMEQGTYLKHPYVRLDGLSGPLYILNADPGLYKVLGCAESGELCYVSTTSTEGKSISFTLMGMLMPGYNVDFFYYAKVHHQDRDGKDTFHWEARYPGKYQFLLALGDVPLTKDPKGPKLRVDGVDLRAYSGFHYECEPDPSGVMVEYKYAGRKGRHALFTKATTGPGGAYAQDVVRVPARRGIHAFDGGARIEILGVGPDSIDYRFKKLLF